MKFKLCPINFTSVKFSHIYRKANDQANDHAHLLAKYAISIDDFLVWIEESLCVLEQTLFHHIFFANIS